MECFLVSGLCHYAFGTTSLVSWHVGVFLKRKGLLNYRSPIGQKPYGIEKFYLSPIPQESIHHTAVHRCPEFIAVLMRLRRHIDRPLPMYCHASINTATKARRRGNCFVRP